MDPKIGPRDIQELPDKIPDVLKGRRGYVEMACLEGRYARK